MNKNDDLWLQAVRHKLEHHASPPPLPPGGWERVEATLSQPRSSRVVPFRRRLLFAAAGVAVVAGIGFVALHTVPTPVEMATQPAHQMATQHSATTASPPLQHAQLRPSAAPAPAAPAPAFGKPLLVKTTPTPTPSAEACPASAATTLASAAAPAHTDTLAAQQPPAAARQMFAATADSTPSRSTAHEYVVTQSTHTPASAYARHSTPLPTELWAFAMSMGGISAGSSPTHETPLLMADAAVESEYSTVANTYRIGRSAIKLKHKLPLRMAIAVSRSLNKRWSVQTGITATHLLSVPDNEVLSNFYNQSIWYVGIPLKIDYRFLLSPHFSVYWTNGVEVEKCVSARRENQNISLRALQWSVNSAVGLQYAPARHVALFAEPGASYYFKNNANHVETYRTQHPLMFDLRVGLKLTY